jgi:hypothetical protein
MKQKIFDELEWEDAVLRHCHVINTLAGLLGDSGRQDDMVRAALVNDTGGMIKDEVTRLKERLKSRPGRHAR